MSAHWTSQSTRDFVYRISSDFAFQIEKKMGAEPINQSELAHRLEVSPGRVSQFLRNPGNTTIKNMVEYARALGMKVAIVAYDDRDPENQNGPINSQIFTDCWEKAGKPNDFFALTECTAVIRNAAPSIHYFEPPCAPYEKKSLAVDTQLTNLVWQQHTTTSKFLTGAGAR